MNTREPHGADHGPTNGMGAMNGVDREAFASLYREHVGRVTSFAVQRVSSPGEVADLVAATFVVALERRRAYDPTKGEPIAWLLGIAANLLANGRRRYVREKLARARLDARAMLSQDDIDRLLTQLDASATTARLRAAMETLSEPHRKVLLVAGEPCLDNTAKAKAVGVTPATYRVRLSRARRALRRAMEGQSPNNSPTEAEAMKIKEALS